MSQSFIYRNRITGKATAFVLILKFGFYICFTGLDVRFKHDLLTRFWSLTLIQLIFEAVRSGFDGRIAIDDVSFAQHPCTAPRMCSFEGQQCGYNSFGKIYWLHRSGYTSTTSGPKVDHTLETEQGDTIGRPFEKRLIIECTVQKAKRRFCLCRFLHDGEHRSELPSCWGEWIPCLPCSKRKC